MPALQSPWFTPHVIVYMYAYALLGSAALWVLIIAFVLLQVCWWGINYLPSARGASVHTYSN